MVARPNKSTQARAKYGHHPRPWPDSSSSVSCIRPEDDFAVLDIKPCVVRDLPLSKYDIHGDQVPEHQRARRCCNRRFTAGLEHQDEPPKRNCRDHVIRPKRMFLPVATVDHVDFAGDHDRESCGHRIPEGRCCPWPGRLPPCALRSVRIRLAGT